jgi:hypothetical protein
MDLENAIELLKKIVKHTGVIDQKHIDLTLVPVDQREVYQKALVVAKVGIKDGKMTQDEFMRKVCLDH